MDFSHRQKGSRASNCKSSRSNTSWLAELSVKDQRDIVCLLLALSILLVFLQVAYFEFVNYDDPAYVCNNPHVAAGLTKANLAWAFTSLHGEISYWHPLTWLSHQLDCQLFGLNPGAHHLINVLFHAANTLLIFVGLHRITGQLERSAVVAALFAFHPLHVESVAWIAERKDVLSAFFVLLTIGAYFRYAKAPSVGRYLRVLFLFVLGLLSKPSVVTLPFALLLLDIWPLGRVPLTAGANRWSISPGLRRCLLEKAPLLALSATACVVTVVAQVRLGSMESLDHLPIANRISNAIVAYPWYIVKLVWPSDLCVLYYHPGSWPAWQVLSSVMFFIGISLLAFWQAKRHPYFLVGWLWFLGTLVPMIGLVQVGAQAFADRYTYVSYLGLFVMVVWGVSEFLHNRKLRPLVFVAACVAVTAFALRTLSELQHWRNSEALFSQALRVDPRNPIAHTDLGIELHARGDVQRAVRHYQAALKLYPALVLPNVYLGNLSIKSNHLVDAAQHFARSLQGIYSEHATTAWRMC
jgi:hypothetical protein